MNSSAIRCESVVREFGGVAAVNGVDLDVEAGEIYGFLGPNGAGKSTTVRMLCTLLAPTSGRASVAGFDVVEQPGRGAAAHRRRAPRSRARSRARPAPSCSCCRAGSTACRVPTRAGGVDELGELIDLDDALDRRIGTYSGGMKRRLDLVAALIHNPQILFLDEPTTGLDPMSRAVRVGRGAPAQPRSRDDDLPHDAVPRRGRRARGSGRHHRPRPHRRRGHADRPEASRSAPT